MSAHLKQYNDGVLQECRGTFLDTDPNLAEICIFNSFLYVTAYEVDSSGIHRGILKVPCSIKSQ